MQRENRIEASTRVLIAARPDRMRDSLRFLLRTMPGIDIIGPADDSSSTLRMVSEHRPALVLLDTNLPGEKIPSLLKQIKAHGSPGRCLVLSENSRQQQETRAAGADAALLKGFSTEQLFETVAALLG
jgi:DNA-binding NarL/FixJ family response regulator